MCKVRNQGSSLKPLQSNSKITFLCCTGMCRVASFLSLLILDRGYDLPGVWVLRTSLRQALHRGDGTALRHHGSPAGRHLLHFSSARECSPKQRFSAALRDISPCNSVNSCCPFPSCIVSAKPCHMKNQNFLHNLVSE